jgi:O-antigen/teichoic acid export membrane protein
LGLLAGILVLAGAASFLTETIVPLLYGAKYKESAHILSVLIFVQAFAWAYMPFGIVMQATHNENLALYISSAKAIMNIFLNVVFFYKFGLIGIAYSTLTVYGVGNFLGSFLIYNRLKKQGYFI